MRNIILTILLASTVLGGAACTNPSGPESRSSSVVSEGDGGPAASTGIVQFANRSDISVYYLYLSPSSSSSWGPDQLGANVLSPGETFTLRGVPCGDVDYKLEGLGHTALLTRYGVPLDCGGGLEINLH